MDAKFDVDPAAPVWSTPEALLRRLEWQVLRRLDGVHSGDHRSRSRGAGVDVVDVRPYEAHDDVRHIDWNVTARLDELHVREFDAERDLTAWLLVDRSASMTLGPSARTKEVVTVELAASIARLLGSRGGRVGAVVLSGGTSRVVIAPGTGRKHVLRLADELLRSTEPAAAMTDLSVLLLPAATMLRRRSAVFVISDFVSIPGWERGLQMLSRRHDVTALEVVDRYDHELPDVGLVSVQDVETGEQVLIDTSDAEFRRRHRQLVDERRADVARIVRGAGVSQVTVTTQDDLAAAMVRLVSTRDWTR